ncbi:MAG: TIGR00366 family protein, partial [Myxococcales bacterium]|nr:TIGR00366 family protein [Myxococcales bacterium]
VVLEEGQIIDTIIDGVARPLAALGPGLAAVSMYAIQSLCNLFIPSGSGQAYVTMPIMAPLADITGVSRQTAVLAFQFGDGFTNMIVPTNAVLVGILGLARIPFERWLRFVMPLMVKLWIAGAIVLVLATIVGYA